MTPPAPTPLSRLRAALVDDLLDRWPRDPQAAPMLAAWEADSMASRIERALSSAGLVLADAVPPPVDAPHPRAVIFVDRGMIHTRNADGGTTRWTRADAMVLHGCLGEILQHLGPDEVPPPVDATDRRCGTCRSWEPTANGVGICRFMSDPPPLPFWHPAWKIGTTLGRDGRDCPAWEARDDGR